jgi:hypothetical protein
MLPSLIQPIARHLRLVADRSTGSSIYSKIEFGL